MNFAVYSSEYAVFRQNLFIVNTMQICRRYFTINILYGLKRIKESALQPL